VPAAINGDQRNISQGFGVSVVHDVSISVKY
jgi:hypothetical protein